MSPQVMVTAKIRDSSLCERLGAWVLAAGLVVGCGGDDDASTGLTTANPVNPTSNSGAPRPTRRRSTPRTPATTRRRG
ncbi:MAG: hypothetical protein IPK80_10120 [Nannocystis sp.]|nr:hypothetical protein [Nannocystis sp.]